MIVDLHAHFVSSELIADARRHGDRYGVEVLVDADGSERLRFLGGPTIRPFFAELCDLDIRLAMMDGAGVGVEVISTWMDIVGYWLPIELGRRWMRLQNETIAEACLAHPDRLWPMGTLPMQDVDAALEELEFCVTALGMRSFEIGTSVNDQNLDEAQFRRFWAAVEEVGALVFLHPPLAPMAAERMDRYFLANINGNPIETTVAASRLIFGGVLEAHPRLRCCLAHAGGFLPYQIGRLDRGYESKPECRTIPAPPSAYLGRFYFDTIGFNDAGLAFLLQMVGPERMCFGSDIPFPMGDPHAAERVRRLPGLGDMEQAAVLGDNALTALGISRT
jgi:aminocarboxymuconate-semialdehyde decarboxylase